jgi:short-subunit dehydrogenase
MKRLDLKGKTIWITGASSGIGASLAIQMNNMGAKVIASARREKKLLQLKDACRFPKNLVTITLDITNQDSIGNAVKEVKLLKKLDLVIHNAGIAQKGMVIENGMEVDRRIMETNYFGTVALTKAILPIFLGQGNGWFGIVSSFAGVLGIPGRSAYAASKHALHGFFDSLKAEHMGCKLDVSIIIPGFINTDITIKELKGNGKPYGKLEKSHRLGMTAEDCASRIIDGLRKKHKRIIVGKMEVLILYIKRISPSLSHYIIGSHPMRKWRKLLSEVKKVLNFIPNLFKEPIQHKPQGKISTFVLENSKKYEREIA